jgi:uncharacterized damage-inducible protein DinB
MNPEIFCDLLIAEARRRILNESIPRLKKCLQQLEDDEIWWKPNSNTNSVGNLTLHLEGNARQWIISGLSGAPDKRDRKAEFSRDVFHSRKELLKRVHQLEKDIDKALEEVNPLSLLRKRRVQVFSENGISVLVHAIEHFSYHVGQITYFVKLRKNIDLGYYKNVDL